MLWRLKKLTFVAQWTMQGEMIATAYGKVQLDWLRDVISEIEHEADLTRCVFNDRQNCVTMLNSGNFQLESQYQRLKSHTIHEAIAKGEIENKHVTDMEMLADALTNALGRVKLCKLANEIGQS